MTILLSLPQSVTMGPVAVVLLATLLPAGFLIVGLACVSTYLYSRLRALREGAKKTEDDDTHDAVAEPPPKFVYVRKSKLMDVERQEWRSDAISSVNYLGVGTFRDAVSADNYCDPGDEVRTS